MFTGVGQISPGNFSPKSQMILKRFFRIEADDNITETFPIAELAEAEGQKMIILGQAFGLPRRGEQLDAAREFGMKDSGSDLREDRTLVGHRASLPMRWQRKTFLEPLTEVLMQPFYLSYFARCEAGIANTVKLSECLQTKGFARYS